MSKPDSNVVALAIYRCRGFDVGFESVFEGWNVHAVLKDAD
jgi:hypothetical protein